MYRNDSNFALIVIILVVLGGVVGGGSCCVNGCAPDYSDGERTGVVWKFSKKGLFRKSWEGELNMGGFHTEKVNDVSQLVPNIFHFSAFEPAAIEKLQAALKGGNKVTLRYKQWFQHPIGRQDSDSEIVDVVPVTEGP